MITFMLQGHLEVKAKIAANVNMLFDSILLVSTGNYIKNHN